MMYRWIHGSDWISVWSHSVGNLPICLFYFQIGPYYYIQSEFEITLFIADLHRQPYLVLRVKPEIFRPEL